MLMNVMKCSVSSWCYLLPVIDGISDYSVHKYYYVYSTAIEESSEGNIM